MFRKTAEKDYRHKKYYGYHPIELTSNSGMKQKLDYIYENPVKEGIVFEPHHYVYSSAIDYSGSQGPLRLDFIY